MIAAIKSAAAITIHPFDSAINYSVMTGVMRRDDSVTSFLLGSTKITTFTTLQDFLVVGCATCDSNSGWIRLYTTDTLRLKKTIKGSSKNSYIGKHVETRQNLIGMSQLWYSSRYKDSMFFSTLLAFRDVKTEAWSFDDQS